MLPVKNRCYMEPTMRQRLFLFSSFFFLWLVNFTRLYSYISNANMVSFGNLSFSQFSRYRITRFAKTLEIMVSQSASRTIDPVPFSKSNKISPHVFP